MERPSRLDRRTLLAGAAASLSLAAAPRAAGATARRAGGRSVLRPTDLAVLGAFALPDDVAGDDAAYGKGLALRRVGGETRLLALGLRETLFEVAVPPTLTAAGTPPRVPVVRVWGDLTRGTKRLDGEGRSAGVYGMHWDEPTGQLLWAYGDGYNATSGRNPSLGVTRLDDAAGTLTSRGGWRLDRSCKMTMGGVTAVPGWFADRHLDGRRLAAGFGGYYSIVQTGPASMGPALAAFDVAALDGEPGDVAALPLVGYPHHPTAYGTPDRCTRDTDYRDDFTGWQPRDGRGWWTWADQIEGAGVWVDTPAVSGFLVLPSMGNGRVWYEQSTLRAERSSHWWYVYDPADLAAVAAGRREEWRIQPRYRWPVRYPTIETPLPGWADVPPNPVAGAAFDPVTNRLYVAVRRLGPLGSDRRGHVIVVYQVRSERRRPWPVRSVT